MAETIVNLEVIFKNVEDITDPSSMDKVLMVLEETRMADDNYMELLVEKVGTETITWSQPWYQKSTCLTRKPKIPANETDTYESGSFTHDEYKRVEKNWNKFVRKFELPNTPVCLARWRNTNKARNSMKSVEEFVRCFVTAYLAKGLKRDLYQVYRHFVQTYAYPTKLKFYTPLEEKIINICFYHSPANAVTILSSVLGREPRGIYKKLFQYYNGIPEKKKLKWTLNLATKFLNGLMHHSGCSLQELRNNKIDKSVWIKLEEDMEQKYCYLRKFWYTKLYVQIFTQCTIKTKTLRRIICKKLKKSSYKIWSDIRWRDLVKKFPDGITAEFMYRVAGYLFKQNPTYLTTPLSEIVAEAIENNNKKTINRRLKCVEFDDDGNLRYVQRKHKLKDLMPMENKYDT
ncbi:uncharacterized protein [Choristoneura fumiferana]|uniref:uncharacterized protein n=1 Tax=Choristoneura fumiferana TaxID=7141 RepID=UPI003D155204